jgi:ABC-type lipoprotein export system ATPase subunit
MMSGSSPPQSERRQDAGAAEQVPKGAKPLLTLTEAAKSYVATDAAEGLLVLRDVNLQLARGEAIAIVGPSGSGKSTLLHIIGTLDRPDSGSVRLDDRELTALPERELAAVRAREIGFIFQLHHLLPQCTVLENVLVPTLARLGVQAFRRSGVRTGLPECPNARPGTRAAGGARLSAEPPEDRARRLLERVGLSERLSHRPGQLSGGERQRAAVVRALINEPELLLADEPTGSLDRAAAENMTQLLVELNREEGVSLIVVTHALPLAAQMSRVLALRDGTLVAASDNP